MTFDDKKYAEEYRAKPKHREKHRLYMKAYYEKNKDKLNQQKREFSKDNPEIVKLWARKTYDKYPEKAYLRTKNWREKNKGRYLKQMRISYHKYYYNPLNQNKIIARIKARNLIKKLFCEKCGNKNQLQQHHPDYNKPLDTITLCQICHKSLHIGGE